MPEVSLRPAAAADRALVERLWLMFHHDLSEFRGGLPDADGTFHGDQPGRVLTDADWAAYLLVLGTSPAGLVLVRGLTGPTRVLNAFFVVRGARRGGVGLDAVRQVVARHPGPWEIPFQDANVAAVHFWRRVAREIAGDAWAEERRAVPHRPDLPPDVWISFDTPPAQAS
ncbi:GNAT family N-acetyltransferase [Streptomyces palmae]|uniref:GNAT family N-acetyltransferase n=1 Tax=Streptomyces palmae TaxID=1701085 RepID=A0A4Z0HCZ9_9ACTN|nr:GNAT family N-acetyltransferase [Streptomyces palmae]TGB12301.1 GNAT family N-acetyltransferase [Streptomyces palmae]